MGAFYTFWAQNIRDSQLYGGDAHPVGSVPDTVPHTFGAYPSDPSWGTAYPGVVYSTWRMLGDVRLAADHYPNLVAYIDFMKTKVAEAGIGKLYQSYGDWCPPGPMPPRSYTSGVAMLVDVQRMVELATALGKAADAAAYAAYRAGLVADFNAAWAHANGAYGDAGGAALQTSNAAALALAGVVPPAARANVTAALVADVTARGHFSTGIIGMRYLHHALVDAGAGDAALATIWAPTYPSFSYMFDHPDEPATTLWELLDAPSEGPGMDSRSHHMFSSPGGWLWEDLAGIDQLRHTAPSYDPAAPDAAGFRHAVLYPRVTRNANLTFVDATYASVSGDFALAWSSPGARASGACAADAPENAPVTLSCAAPFTGVIFASFGTPTGACGAFAKGACDAANSSAIVAAACVGQTACTIDVSTALFGDPCFNTLKHFNAQLACPAATGISLAVTVPTNARATVRVPFAAGTPLANLTVLEGGVPVFARGAFVPGVAGVAGAAVGAEDTPAGDVTVDVLVGAGSYAFSTTV